MTAPHTPGPWHWAGNTLEPVEKNPNRSAVYSILDAEGGYGFISSDFKATCAELDADRLLIAAAPELLEALQMVVKVADRATIEFDAARAAIAKATGPTT